MYTLSSTALEPGICYSAVHLRSRFCIKRTWTWVYTLRHRSVIILTHCAFCCLFFPVPSPKVKLHHSPRRVTEIISGLLSLPFYLPEPQSTQQLWLLSIFKSSDLIMLSLAWSPTVTSLCFMVKGHSCLALPCFIFYPSFHMNFSISVSIS